MNIIGGIDMTDLDVFIEMFNPEPNSWISFSQNQNRPKLTEPQGASSSIIRNKDFLKSAEHRFVVICKTNINQRLIFHNKAQFHNQPENYLKVS